MKPSRGSARVLGRGEVPLVVLALLAEAPRHGYEIIRCIEERCRGGYSPSPGVIYPTLTMLVEQALSCEEVASPADLGKRRYAITRPGRRYLADQQAIVDGAFARMEHVARMRVRESMPTRIREAMETLKRALMAAPEAWSDEEAERVANEIEKAATAIKESST